MQQSQVTTNHVDGGYTGGHTPSEERALDEQHGVALRRRRAPGVGMIVDSDVVDSAVEIVDAATPRGADRASSGLLLLFVLPKERGILVLAVRRASSNNRISLPRRTA